MYYTPHTFNITSGQITIFGGLRQLGFSVLSGAAWVNGAQYPAPTALTWGAIDSKMVLTTTGTITVGCTGGCVVGFYLN